MDTGTRGTNTTTDEHEFRRIVWAQDRRGEWVLYIVGGGFVSGWLSNSGYGNPWFDALVKPAFMPPGWMFRSMWMLLYAAVAVAAWLVWLRPAFVREQLPLLAVWAALGVTALSAAVGLLASREVFRHTPLEALREE